MAAAPPAMAMIHTITHTLCIRMDACFSSSSNQIHSAIYLRPTRVLNTVGAKLLLERIHSALVAHEADQRMLKHFK